MWASKTAPATLRAECWYGFAFLALTFMLARATAAHAAHPVIFEGGIVNAASFAPDPAPLAPGSIAIIFGTNLNDGSVITSSGYDSNSRLVSTLAGTSVYFDRVPVPIFYSVHGDQYDQVAVQVPFELAGQPFANVEVTVDGQTSVSRRVLLNATAPGIFTLTQDGKGTALLFHSDGVTQVTPEEPAQQGEVVVLYATGLGLLQPSLQTGVLASGNPTAERVTVTVDGVQAPVQFSGAAAGFVGLYQVNFQIPVTTRVASDVPIILSVDADQSNAALIAVGRAVPVLSDLGVLWEGARDIAYDPFRNLLYAGTASENPVEDFRNRQHPHPNSVLVIDSTTRAVVQILPSGKSPHRLALSSNGRYLWIALDVDQAIQRIDLNTRQIEFTVRFAELFSDLPRPNSDGYYRLAAMRPHPTDDNLLVIAFLSTDVPVSVLDGPHRRPRVGPFSDRRTPTYEPWNHPSSIVFNADGTFWTDHYRFAIDQDGLRIIESAPANDTSNLQLMTSIPGLVLERRGALRRPTDLLRIGRLSYGNIFSRATQIDGVENAVYVMEDGLVYFGGGFPGASNFSIQAWDPVRMIPVAEVAFADHLLPPDFRPKQGSPSRLVSLGPEGFALAFGDPYPDVYGNQSDDGGPLYFFPKSLITPYANFPLPGPQPATGGIRRIRLPVASATVDRRSGKVFFTMPNWVTGVANSILGFDPATAVLDPPVWVGSEPDAVAITSDSRYLYVFLAGSSSVKRFRLPSLEQDQEFPVRTRFGALADASTLLPVPGAPSTSIAVHRTAPSAGQNAHSRGTVIYDDGHPRPKGTSTYSDREGVPGLEFSIVNSAQFSASGAYLFAINNEGSSFEFTRWRVTPDGFIGDAGKLGLSTGFGSRLKCSDTLCVTSRGVLLDPISMERVRMFGGASLDDRNGSFTNLALVALGAENDRVYFNVTSGLPGAGILAYQISTGNLVGTLAGEFRGSEMQLLRSGELMITGGSEIILIPTNLLQ